MIERVRAGLQAIPGVSRVGVGAMVPLDGSGLGLGELHRKGERGNETELNSDWNVISPDFFPAIELPIVRGRNFSTTDRADGDRVAIVNETFAAKVWPGEDPVGKQLEYGDFRAGHEKEVRTVTVVGIAKDAKYRWVGETQRRFIYVPLAQEPWRRTKFFLAADHRADQRADLTRAVRQALRNLDPNLPLIDFTPMTDFAALGMLPQTIGASVAGTLGALALLLAAVGLYGVMAYAVTRRTREIGVRMALGADRRAVVSMVIVQGARLAIAGGILGIALAAAAAFGLSSAGMLFGTSRFDPIAFGGTTLLMMLVALVATYIPARRAASVDPLKALRAE
jgi:predicted permease